MTQKNLSKEELKGVIEPLLTGQELLYAVLSQPERKSEIRKATIRPILVKNKSLFQITEEKAEKAFHNNIAADSCLETILELMETTFREVHFFSKTNETHIWKNKNNLYDLRTAKTSSLKASLPHNRQKNYLLPEGTPLPFFEALGIMNKEGAVRSEKRHKFKQTNRFLEIVTDTLGEFDTSKPLRIVDIGCGKAYLTFALYYYLEQKQARSVEILGIDLKKEVVQELQNLSDSLGFKHLKFIQADIEEFEMTDSIDMMISLHACDTATDSAIEKAIQWGAKVILSVPCCQHELLNQVHSSVLNPLLKHGILRERFAALVTDACRAEILSILNYKTQVLEFIDFEHTHKNLLIRAIKKRKPLEEGTLESYLNFKRALKISPWLGRKLNI